MRLTGGNSNVCSNTAYTLNEWHHLVVVFFNGTSTFYLDGVFDGSGENGSNIRTNDLDLYIGKAHVGCNGSCGLNEFFNGSIDDIRNTTAPSQNPKSNNFTKWTRNLTIAGQPTKTAISTSPVLK